MPTPTATVTQSSSPQASAVASRPAATPTVAPSAQVTALGSRHVAGDVVKQADARRFAPMVNGSWAGAWRDDSGLSGTSDITLAVDPMRLKARGTLTFDGPLLAGATIPPATYEIDLLGFARDAATWTVITPQFGVAAVTADGGVNATASCHDIPQAPGAQLEMTGTRLGSRVDVRYTITDASGKKTIGTAAWGKGSVRATPQDPRNTRHDSLADILSGAYAADFLDAIDLSKAMSRPMKPPIPNGGRIQIYAGIDVSNTYAETVDGFVRVDLQVYRSNSAATATAWWKQNLHKQPQLPGPWKAAFFQAPGYPVFYCWVGNLMFIITVGQTVAGAKRALSAATRERDCKAVAGAVARAAAKR
ncbi:hypothetical protein acdb102_03970 [Acidothermaceae bacterium B102]|nr:hypothetical protein acdb102_03970 [Acidothermaceae bacterium B102]